MWPFNRKPDPATLAVDLHVAVSNSFPTQGGEHEDAPPWAVRLIRFLVAKWPTLLQLLLLILEQSTERMSTQDRADAVIALNRYRRYTDGQFKVMAASLGDN